ncbi:MAG: DsbA family protein [Bacteroidia bacterium]
MKSRIILIWSFFIFLFTSACDAQTPNMKNQVNHNNPLLCNPDSGTCELTNQKQEGHTYIPTSQNKSIHIVYFTDPICSSCWGIEPQLRKLKLEYGDEIEIEYIMGGLLPDWSYNSGGISKPSDVAHHWDEVSKYYQMPIDGDIWLEDPLSSSYPPSIAFKAAQLQDQEKALRFLRRIREMVFLEKKNICKIQYINQAASETKLDTAKLNNDIQQIAIELFQNNLRKTAESGVRGFPTLILSNQNKQYLNLNGFQVYSNFESAILQLNPSAKKKEYSKTWEFLFQQFSSLTLREFAELSGQNMKESLAQLKVLTEQKKLTVFETKNGAIWRIAL